MSSRDKLNQVTDKQNQNDMNSKCMQVRLSQIAM